MPAFIDEPGTCLRCHEAERAGVYSPADDAGHYSHVCTDCQDECEAYFPCLICHREIYKREPPLSTRIVMELLESDELCICPECHKRIKQLLAMGYAPRQIGGNYRGDGASRQGRIQQICEAVQIGRANWIICEVTR